MGAWIWGGVGVRVGRWVGWVVDWGCGAGGWDGAVSWGSGV